MANSGSFKKGDGRARKPKGTPNKLTTALKDMILQALANKGGVTYLEAQADVNPNAFLALVGRVLPLQVKEGGDDPTVPTTIVRHVYEAEK
ncbi:MAG: hypothetical protein RLY20_879 [Verrucomicrobiota bacterium]|jgi:hypothetical protein